MLPRPHVRMPLWTVFAVVAGAYLLRSATRGFDFRPELPADAVVLVALVVVVSAVAWVRADNARHERDAAGSNETDPDD